MPLAVAALTLGASAFGAADPRPRRHLTRDSIYAVAAATGLAGLAFHTVQHQQAPGRPVLAEPVLRGSHRGAARVSSAGLLRVRGLNVHVISLSGDATRARHFGGPCSGGDQCRGTGGGRAEAALMHFRGAYHNPAMTLPVTVPPVAQPFARCGRLCPGTPNRAPRPLVAQAYNMRSVLLALAFTPMVSRAIWAAGAIGARTC